MVAGLMTVLPAIGYAISPGRAKQKAAGAVIVLLLALLLPFLLASPVGAGTVQLTFAWEQTISADFGGWKLHKATIAGGPYTEFADIKYDGQQKQEYSSTQPLMSPDGQEVRYYFVATAYDTRGNKGGYSNEVNELIDFKAPEIPVKFTVTVIPAP